jgi:hypothetical protein
MPHSFAFHQLHQTIAALQPTAPPANNIAKAELMLQPVIL